MKKNKVKFYFQKAGSKAMVNGLGKGKKRNSDKYVIKLSLFYQRSSASSCFDKLDAF